MSSHDYLASQKLARQNPSFSALIMAAMRQADSTNAEGLQRLWPEIWAELQVRMRHCSVHGCSETVTAYSDHRCSAHGGGPAQGQSISEWAELPAGGLLPGEES